MSEYLGVPNKNKVVLGLMGTIAILNASGCSPQNSNPDQLACLWGVGFGVAGGGLALLYVRLDNNRTQKANFQKYCELRQEAEEARYVNYKEFTRLTLKAFEIDNEDPRPLADMYEGQMSYMMPPEDDYIDEPTTEPETPTKRGIFSKFKREELPTSSREPQSPIEISRRIRPGQRRR